MSAVDDFRKTYRFHEMELLGQQHAEEVDRLRAGLAEVQKDEERLLIKSPSAALGNGSPFEEAVIEAGTKYIARTIGFYPTGDRRFTIGLYNSMLQAALDAAKGGGMSKSQVKRLTTQLSGETADRHVDNALREQMRIIKSMITECDATKDGK